jgi:hypothetical protein
MSILRSKSWKTTELEAINILLATIGSQPVNSPESPSVDVSMARAALRETALSVLSMGWYFNTDQERTWTPDGNKLIFLPNSIMLVDNSHRHPDARTVTDRSNPAFQNRMCLYDLRNRTFLFDSPIITKTVYGVNWEDMPQPARHYITIRAARVFQDRSVGSEKHHSFTLRDEQLAMAALRRHEAETADHSIFDDYSVSRVIDRAYPHMTGQ